MIAWIRWILEALGFIPRTDFVAVVNPDHPDQDTLAAGVLHVVGDASYQKWAFMKCPCGCGTPIMLALSPKQRPSWNVSIDWLERPTLSPSVWQTDGCLAHFFIREGRVEWCKGTGKVRPPIQTSTRDLDVFR